VILLRTDNDQTSAHPALVFVAHDPAQVATGIDRT
jgi:hypothetical protein